MNEKSSSLRVQFVLCLTAVAGMAVASGINDSIFNNFLSDTFHLSAGQRGWLELPRELPGFMVVVMTGILSALSITRLGMVGTFGAMLGLIGMSFFGRSYWPMLLMMKTYSAGIHLLQPVTASIALAIGPEATRGKRFGQMGGIETAGTVLGTGFVWLVFDKAAPQYRFGFFLAGIFAALACGIYASMNIARLHQPRSKLVFRKKFTLYYLLELLFGARKQIFLTFGPWVLIKIYHQPASSIASLLMLAAIIGIVFKPIVGLAIDHFGERKVLMFDAFMLIFVCVGYGYALHWTSPEHARWIAGACFIGDNLLFALGSARAVYVARITDSTPELTSTLAMGVSINHIISMTIPALAGFVWLRFGYERVFMAAAVLAIIVGILASFVPKKKTIGDPQPENDVTV